MSHAILGTCLYQTIIDCLTIIQMNQTPVFYLATLFATNFEQFIFRNFKFLPRIIGLSHSVWALYHCLVATVPQESRANAVTVRRNSLSFLTTGLKFCQHP